ncbi:hypothetical protein GN956_G20325 [Arapaima gigas]
MSSTFTLQDRLGAETSPGAHTETLTAPPTRTRSHPPTRILPACRGRTGERLGVAGGCTLSAPQRTNGERGWRKGEKGTGGEQVLFNSSLRGFSPHLSVDLEMVGQGGQQTAKTLRKALWAKAEQPPPSSGPSHGGRPCAPLGVQHGGLSTADR